MYMYILIMRDDAAKCGIDVATYNTAPDGRVILPYNMIKMLHDVDLTLASKSMIEQIQPATEVPAESVADSADGSADECLTEDAAAADTTSGEGGQS